MDPTELIIAEAIAEADPAPSGNAALQQLRAASRQIEDSVVDDVCDSLIAEIG